jgi:hypothetical protein
MGGRSNSLPSWVISSTNSGPVRLLTKQLRAWRDHSAALLLSVSTATIGICCRATDRTTPSPLRSPPTITAATFLSELYALAMISIPSIVSSLAKHRNHPVDFNRRLVTCRRSDRTLPRNVCRQRHSESNSTKNHRHRDHQWGIAYVDGIRFSAIAVRDRRDRDSTGYTATAEHACNLLRESGPAAFNQHTLGIGHVPCSRRQSMSEQRVGTTDPIAVRHGPVHRRP